MVKEIRDSLVKPVINGAIWYLSSSSDKNLMRLATIAEKVDPIEYHKEGIRRFKELIKENHPGAQLGRRFLDEVNPNYRRGFINNFLVNVIMAGGPRRRRLLSEEGMYSPFTILISPTMRCNLRCKGCYAGNYAKKDDLELEVIDRIISEAKEMGTYYFTILGGEPFIREDMLKIYEKHNDVAFQVFTNSYFLDDKLCDKLAKLGNVAPMMSLEGFKKETDERRGEGTFRKVMEAMDRLKKRGILFGTSVVPTRFNIDTITSDKFVNMLIEKGSFVIWYFLYMPVGKNPDLNLMPTPEQRNELRIKTRGIRNNKPIFVVDFWGDAPLVGGCIAGREYIHINSKGDVEPCVFAHFAVDNIKEKSLKEVFNSPFIKNIRGRIPYVPNLLRPCMIIDNPYVIREVCKEMNPRPTHEGAEILLDGLASQLDEYAQRVEEVYEPIWKKEYEHNFDSQEDIKAV